MKILCFGESLLRYSTLKGHRIKDLSFQVHVGGSETNIAVNMSQLGFQTALLTKLPCHQLGDAVIAFLKSFGVDTQYIQRNNMRIGSYFLENGSGNRASEVIYDRKDSAMTSFDRNDYIMKDLFEGVDVFVTSGITAALNSRIQEIVLDMMKYCNDHHIKVVYDSNYRAKMWSIEAAGTFFQRVLPYVDILSAGILDAKNFLNLNSYKQSFEEQLEDYYNQMKAKYPRLQYITSTQREIISTSVNQLTGYLYDGQLHISKTYVIDDIVDRVGGGDAFFSGILYGLFHQKDIQYTLEFACCSSVLKHTIHGDAN